MKSYVNLSFPSTHITFQNNVFKFSPKIINFYLAMLCKDTFSPTEASCLTDSYDICTDTLCKKAENKILVHQIFWGK